MKNFLVFLLAISILLLSSCILHEEKSNEYSDTFNDILPANNEIFVIKYRPYYSVSGMGNKNYKSVTWRLLCVDKSNGQLTRQLLLDSVEYKYGLDLSFPYKFSCLSDDTLVTIKKVDMEHKCVYLTRYNFDLAVVSIDTILFNDIPSSKSNIADDIYIHDMYILFSDSIFLYLKNKTDNSIQPLSDLSYVALKQNTSKNILTYDQIYKQDKYTVSSYKISFYDSQMKLFKPIKLYMTSFKSLYEEEYRPMNNIVQFSDSLFIARTLNTDFIFAIENDSLVSINKYPSNWNSILDTDSTYLFLSEDFKEIHRKNIRTGTTTKFIGGN